MILIIVLLIIVISTQYKRSKIVSFLLLGICIVVMGLNTTNPDYESYVNRYEWAAYPEDNNLLSLLDITYSSFQALFKDIGVGEYSQFRFFHTTLIFFIFGWFVSKECVYCNIFLMIYLFFYIILDTIQIRNFTGFIVLLPFIPFLRYKTMTSTVAYIGGVLFATTIHFSMIFFLLFLFINIKSRKIRLLSVLLFIFVLILSSSIISSTAAFERADEYPRSSVFGALFGILFVAISFIIMKKATLKNKELLFHSRNKIIQSRLDYDLINDINFMLLFITPLFFINATVGRIFRYISIINIIFLLNTIYLSNVKKDKFKWGLITFVYVLYFGVHFIYLNSDVYMPVLTKNSLFGSVF